MKLVAGRAVKFAAVLGAGVAVLSLAAYVGLLPEWAPWYRALADNALLILVGSTCIASGLLAIASRGWGRVVAIIAFVPGVAAICLVVLLNLVPTVRGELFGSMGFLLVEIAPTLEAVLVAIVAAALVVDDVRSVLTSRL